MKKRILSLLLILASMLVLVGCIDVRATTPYIPVTEQESAIISAIQTSEAAVVAVVTGTGHGSGVIVKKDLIEGGDALYYVLTNHHVIEDAEDISIHFGVRNAVTGSLSPSTSSYFVKDVQSTPNYDIAVLRFEAPRTLEVDILPIIPNNTTRLEIVKGQTVIAIGSPYNWKEYFNYATIGSVSQVDFVYNNIEKLSIKTDVAINPGNSGGALINLRGELIGINTSKIANISTSTGYIAAEGLGNALNMNVIGPHVLDYKEAGYEVLVKKPRLGITVMNMEDFKNASSIYDITKVVESDEGIVVVSVDSFRGAYEKVLKYDLITKVNGVSVTTTQELSGLLGTMEFGQKHTLTVLRLVGDESVEFVFEITII